MFNRAAWAFLLAFLTVFVAHAAGPPPIPAAGSCEAKLGIRGTWAAQVALVQPDSVAASLGLEPGDLITGFNGRGFREFERFDAFLAAMRQAATEDRANIEVLKYDQESESYRPATVVAVLRPEDHEPDHQILGLKCGFVFMVTDVLNEGPARRMGLKPGEFIERINDRVMANLEGPAAADALLKEIEESPGKEISIDVVHWKPADARTRTGQDARRLKGKL